MPILNVYKQNVKYEEMRFDNNIRKAHAHQKRIKKSYENLEGNFVYSALN